MTSEYGTEAGGPGRAGRAARADDRWLRAFHQAFRGHVELPTSAVVIEEPVTVVEVVYDGSTRRGLTARCRKGHGSEHVVALADVRLPEDSEAARLVARYRAWLSVGITANAPLPMSHPVELTVVSLKERAARCRLLGTDGTITVGSR